MAQVGFFGHNANDNAVRRRAVAMMRAGLSVQGFMMSRGAMPGTAWPTVDLGRTRDNAYAQRIRAILSGARRAASSGRLAGIDIAYARNLDMLATAHLALALARLKRPVVFECLDIHRALTGGGPAGAALSALERFLLRRTAMVVISSPAFRREYFVPRYGDTVRTRLVENRLIEGDALPLRPHLPAAPEDGKLRIGWFGNLRCARSFALLKQIALRHRGRVDVHLAGYPAPGVFDDFDGAVSATPNMRFTGRYKAPEDLEDLYAGVDLIWAGDFFEAGANSSWLLPNRVYEGGYFATPQIAPAGTETARFIKRLGAGFTLEEPLEETFDALIGALIADPGPIAEAGARLVALPDDTYVEPIGFSRSVLLEVLNGPFEHPVEARAAS